ncbi:MAG: 2OG-Fe dioxygenase family protein [Xylophilus ampelinus]
MTAATFAPPHTPLDRLDTQMRAEGYAVLSAADVARWTGVPPDALDALRASWDGLPPDEYLRDGGRYRRRRHACFVADGAGIRQVPHRAHWQPVEYNALHGGMERWFAPMLQETVDAPAWDRLLRALAALAPRMRPTDADGAPERPAGAGPWFVEAHQFRIDTTDGIGRPTPEGAHRDGVDLVAVFLVGRHGIKGGETRVFEAHGPRGSRFTLTEPWSVLLLDDARTIHESTPIQPLVSAQEAGGGGAGGAAWRDTLVVTLRAGGFQGDDAPRPAEAAAE